MKLYTEEQVKSAFRIGLREDYIDEQDAENFANKSIKYLTPIELPSDEEIDILANETFEQNNNIGKILWKDGIKWMKEQILNQNK